LNSLTPLFTLLVGIAFFGRKTRWINVTGVIIGLVGAVGLLSAASDPAISKSIAYGLFAVGGAVCYAFNMNIIKTYLSEFDALTITSVAFLFIGIPSLVYLMGWSDFMATMANHPESWKSLGYIAILAIVGTSLAMIIHNWLIKRTSPLFTATVTYMMPIVSIFWGVADGERFVLFFLLWIALILVGVYLANRPRPGMKKPPAALDQAGKSLY